MPFPSVDGDGIFFCVKRFYFFEYISNAKPQILFGFKINKSLNNFCIYVK
jgi:hypothetical protein